MGDKALNQAIHSLRPQGVYIILAYYLFTPVNDPYAEVAAHKEFFCGRDVTCRIYISEEGINGQMCAEQRDAEAYMAWIASHPIFSSLHFKLTTYSHQVFPRVTVKYRKQLVAIDAKVQLSKGGEYLLPQQWKQWLRDGKKHVMLDVRNNYEWKVGHFTGAEEPPCTSFRDFNRYVDELAKKIDSTDVPVLMYCTGGIRCEVYSVLLKERGFANIYQLKGGVIHYGEQVGNDFWRGKLFVFDDRLTVSLQGEGKAEVIGRCHHCEGSIEDYYNCANMDCNELFLCCEGCLQEYCGCCRTPCLSAPRLRPLAEQQPHAPFQRWHHYFMTKPKAPRHIEER